MEESLNDLDNKMQDLYTKMGWGKYNDPLKYTCSLTHNTASDITRTTETISADHWNTIHASKETLNQLLLDMDKKETKD